MKISSGSTVSKGTCQTYHKNNMLENNEEEKKNPCISFSFALLRLSSNKVF